ncbi:nuclear transport factor 2 family protein [Nocardiopsis mangrovi]|uniref:Nuclear transport factor 2 family protein n=1 Tax=Nocardiopsis mangrovi TaxID=1179818 RepID=A0ABV9DUD6_9ACTN
MTETDTARPDVEDVRSAARQAFRNHLDFLSSGRIPEWVDLFTEDGVLEFPYGPEGYPSKVSGKAGLRAYMDKFPDNFRVDFIDLRFHDTVEPSLVIAEFRSQGIALATGRPYEQTYISVVETKNGKISRYVDFWNPLVAEKALGAGQPDSSGIVTAFGSE